MSLYDDIEERDEVYARHVPAPVALDIMRMAWRRKSLVLLGATGCLLIGLLYYVQRSPIYESEARVLVVKKRPDALPTMGQDPGVSYTEDYVSAHVAFIQSPLIVGQAVTKRRLQNLQSFRDEPDDTIATILDSLEVIRDKKEPGGSSSSILTLSFRGLVAEESPIVLNAIMDSYREFLEETYKGVNEETLKLVTEQAQTAQKELHEKGIAYQEFQKKSPLMWNGSEGTDFHTERLIDIESKRSEVRIRRTEIQARLAAVRKGLDEGRDAAAMLAMIAVWEEGDESAKAGATSAYVAGDKLLELLMQEQKLLEDFGPDHPEVRSIRVQVMVARNYLATRLNEVKSESDTVQAYVTGLEQELDDLTNADQCFATLFEEEQKSARELTSYEIEDKQFISEMASAEKFYDSLIQQLQGINLGMDLGGYSTSVIQPAEEGLQVVPNPVLVLLGSLTTGLLSGLGLAYLAEMSDKSFRNPDEIRRRLQLPLIGHIPFIAAEAEHAAVAGENGHQFDSTLCTFFRSKSIEAEAYRGVRTALFFSTQGQRHKLIQITSPAAGDGKTTLACNLAVSLAQSDKQTLLIDADMRKPRVDKMFGIQSNVGLSSLLLNQADYNDVILPSGIPGLSILPCGPRPPNPAELLTLPRFDEVLATVKERYDFVIIDTPPILAVTDPCVVAGKVDGTLLTLSNSKHGRPKAERAKQILNSLKAKVFGVVVNGADRLGTPRRYSSEQYRDAYAYGYGYGYGYGSGYDVGEKSYYSPEGTGDAGDDSERTNDKAGRGLKERRLPFLNRFRPK